MNQLQLPANSESNCHELNDVAPSIKRLIRYMVQLSRPFQELLITVFEQPQLWECFIAAPSSCNGHHCEQGGNVRHTLEVVELAIAMAAPFKSFVDDDVLITAALLHDVGKALEYISGHQRVVMSAEGKLVGHKLNGYALVCIALSKTQGITEIQSLGLRNSLIALEWPRGDARGTATLEGTILRKADQLSSAADLFAKSYSALSNANGTGTRHPHLPETPWHIKTKPVMKKTSAERLREMSSRQHNGQWSVRKA